ATLSDLIRDTVEDPDCIPTCIPGSEGASFRKAMADLFVKGHIVPAEPPRVLPVSDVLQAKAKPAATPVAVPGPAAKPGDPLTTLIHREINGFVVDMFGRFLNPMLLAAIRREMDPGFTEAQLQNVLQSMFQRTSLPAPMALEPAPIFIAQPQGSAAPQTETIPTAPLAAPPPEAAKSRDVGEEVIEIIMEVTGYERDEIEPRMDLRLDLGIRSSRLPIIVDNLEKRFALQIRMEDFLDVRTVADMTRRIAELTQGALPDPGPREPVPVPSQLQSPDEAPGAGKDDLKRLVFRLVPVDATAGDPLQLTAGTSVCLLAPTEESPLCKELAELLRESFGASVQIHRYLQDVEAGFGGEIDAEVFIILLDAGADPGIQDVRDACGAQERLFLLLKQILATPSRKSVLLLHDDRSAPAPRRVLADGMLGMFLCAALEYPSLQFRTATLRDGHAGLHDVLRHALDKDQALLDLSFDGDGVTTLAGCLGPVEVSGSPNLQLRPGDVVVISGGGYGITAQLARALAPFAPRIAILGRTPVDLPGKLAERLLKEEVSEKALRWEVMQQNPNIGFDDLGAQIERLHKARQVLSTLEDLRHEGLEVEYLACDVTDAGQVQTAMDQVLTRYGRVDGIVHGAGILKDTFLADMDLEAFRSVVQVKLLGAWNLFNGCRRAGLKFFFALSSIVAIQGNMGQANYGAGNRMMSRLLQLLSNENQGVLFKALMLPPVSGGGMAESREVREILERFGVGYIGTEELTEMFCRELFFGAHGDPWVMWMKSLPAVKTALLEGVNLAPPQRGSPAGLMAFSPQDHPLIDSVEALDLHQGVLAARRTFSREKDLWIADHKPFKFLKQPLVSAIMAVEAFLEASRLLFPYLHVTRVQGIRFLDTIEVSPDGEREALITCRRTAHRGIDVRCECVMEAYGVSPGGRKVERLDTCYRAEIHLAGKSEEAPVLREGFPIPTDEFTGRPMEKNEIVDWYEKRSDMKGLYRVLEHIGGHGPGIISGRMIPPDAPHFSFANTPKFHYPPYALEGLMQLCSYYVVMRDESEERAMIPAGIGSVRWFGTHGDGSPITLQARLKREDDQGLVWDAMASQEDGDPLLELSDLHMQWFDG
ncbi:MAG: SDR family NAD(P)-dependent oxidoreductase, partial [Syntrophobacteraceae bacterium]|nr:SDR family NAD(P)-dependent oxidoreductase [Syntrophobacteraceae bacterium]